MKFTEQENIDALQEETAPEVMFCFWLLQVSVGQEVKWRK